MTDYILFDSERFAALFMWVGAGLASLNLAAVVVARAIFAIGRFRRRRIERRYTESVRRALDGDPAALRHLGTSPKRHRFYIARLMAMPLWAHRDPERVARTRAIFEAMSMVEVADRWLVSFFWWKRATAIRALGVLQIRTHTAGILAAFDDDNPDVRAAALDAIADLRDPKSLMGVVVRLHDESLPRGRRFAAIAAFGTTCEPLLLEMATADAANRLNYARALGVCGTSRSVPTLSRWTQDPDVEVRATAFEALGHIGLDADTAPLALAALEREDLKVRAMAASALRGWTGSGDVAVRLSRHLDDQWPVAVRAAHSLKTMGDSGVTALTAIASRSDLAGELARQTLWEITARC